MARTPDSIPSFEGGRALAQNGNEVVVIDSAGKMWIVNMDHVDAKPVKFSTTAAVQRSAAPRRRRRVKRRAPAQVHQLPTRRAAS